MKLIEFESKELFLISFDELLQNIEFITNSFANKTFEYRLISTNINYVLINESFSFISITEPRYDDRKFKSILMNCETASRSTDKIEQFKALQRISDVALNKKTIELDINDSILILSPIEWCQCCGYPKDPGIPCSGRRPMLRSCSARLL
jgi:hypothetical protein